MESRLPSGFYSDAIARAPESLILANFKVMNGQQGNEALDLILSNVPFLAVNMAT
jgi:hypothetical protein